MKLPALVLSGLVIAITASAADPAPKPDDILGSWTRTVTELAATDFTTAVPLREHCPPPQAFQEWAPASAMPAPTKGLRRDKSAPDLLRPEGYDAKTIPPGAKPYQYRGETYWLIPIATT